MHRFFWLSAFLGLLASCHNNAGPTTVFSADTCTVPIALAEVSKPTTVISDCSFSSLKAAVQAGGVITFTCQGTISFAETLTLRGDVNTTIDGGGVVTFDGNKQRMFTVTGSNDPTGKYWRTCNTTVTLQRLTLQNAAVVGTTAIPPSGQPASDKCSTGYTDGAGGALMIDDVVLHVIDCTFNNNSAEPLGPDVGGGAIYALGSKDVTIVGSTFSGNTGANGGAIGSLWSNLTLVNDTFMSNRALGFGENGDAGGPPCPKLSDGQYQTGSGGNGGAISIDGGESNPDNSPTVSICGTTFSGNQAGALGGALFRTPDASEQETDINQCSFSGNQAVSGGGAGYFHNNALDVGDTLFSGNQTSGDGGAFFIDTSNPLFVNVTFVGNTAAGRGGAIAFWSDSGTVQNCTFSGNQAPDASPWGFGGALVGSPLAITNSIFSDNSAAKSGATCSGSETGSHDLQWPATSSSDPACLTGITVADPELAPLANNGGPTETLLPAANSPAVAAGVSCPDHDQRLKPRNTNKCTLGAVEVE